MRFTTFGILSMALAASLMACATPRGAYLNKDEPENRLMSSQMTGASSQTSGYVARVDEPQQVIVLDNGQMYRVAGPEAVYVDGRPVALSTVRPGSNVTIVSGTPVYYVNGQYVTTPPTGFAPPGAPGGVVATPAPGAVAAAPGTVVAAPGTTVVTTAPAGSPIRLYGRVVDVDRKEIKIRTQDGHAFEVPMPAGTSGIKKGDAVTVDMTFGGAPAASPR
jgi:hypothetical protein